MHYHSDITTLYFQFGHYFESTQKEMLSSIRKPKYADSIQYLLSKLLSECVERGRRGTERSNKISVTHFLCPLCDVTRKGVVLLKVFK